MGPRLFSLYINDLSSCVKFCNIESYVDDTKIYLSFTTKDVDLCLHQISQDLHSVARWCCSNHLLINPEKTQLVLFGVNQLLSRLPSITIPFLGANLVPKTSAKDLGIIIDSNLSFCEHTNSLTSSLLSNLCQINRVKHLFPRNVLQTIINSLVFSKLYYCSTVWAGTYKYNIQKLQLIQNFAARILTNTKKYNHITPALNFVG